MKWHHCWVTLSNRYLRVLVRMHTLLDDQSTEGSPRTPNLTLKHSYIFELKGYVKYNIYAFSLTVSTLVCFTELHTLVCFTELHSLVFFTELYNLVCFTELYTLVCFTELHTPVDFTELHILTVNENA